MKRIVWTAEARSEFRRAITYLAGREPAAARLVRRRIHDDVQKLAENSIGHPGRVEGTYEKLVRRTSYVIAYALSDDVITILHVIHTRRDWPEGAWPRGEG